MTHEARIDFRTQHQLDFGRGDEGPICKRCGRTIYMDMLARVEICPGTASNPLEFVNPLVERYAKMLDEALGIIRRPA
jgi:hypothetical protein